MPPPANTLLRPTLLIIDDDPEVLRALAFVADTRGFDVELCRTAREAITVAGARPPFGCLVIDQVLGDDRGIDVLATLRSRGIAAPAILITTAPSEELIRRAAALGVPIVEKPLLDEMLFTQIDRLIRSG